MQLPDFITKAVEFFGFARQRLETLPDAVQSQGKIADLEGKLAQSQADLATAKQTIGSLETQVKALQSELETAKTAASTAKTEGEKAKAEGEKAKAEADKVASQKAAQITAAQGQPALDVKPNEKPATAKTEIGDLTGLDKAIAANKASYQSAK